MLETRSPYYKSPSDKWVYRIVNDHFHFLGWDKHFFWCSFKAWAWMLGTFFVVVLYPFISSPSFTLFSMSFSLSCAAEKRRKNIYEIQEF